MKFVNRPSRCCQCGVGVNNRQLISPPNSFVVKRSSAGIQWGMDSWSVELLFSELERYFSGAEFCKKLPEILQKELSLKSCVFRGTRRTPTGLNLVKIRLSPSDPICSRPHLPSAENFRPWILKIQSLEFLTPSYVTHQTPS